MSLASFVLSMFLSGCGVKEAKKNTESTPTFNSAAYLVIDNESLTSNSTLLSGNGSVVFVAPLADDAHNFHLNFELEDGGSLALVYGSDNKLQQGLSLILSRNGKSIELVTKAGDNTSAPAPLAGVDASAPLALNLDVHNDETPAHVMIWKNDDTTELLMDSEESTETAGNGQSNLWGVELKKAKVTRADVRTAAHEE